MQRLLFLLTLLPALALGATWAETQPLTRAPPTGLPSSISPTPLNLYGATRYRVVLCAEEGATLSGTGELHLWVWDVVQATWARPSAVLPVVLTSRCQAWGLEADVRSGYLLPATVGVGVSAGATVRVSILTDSF